MRNLIIYLYKRKILKRIISSIIKNISKFYKKTFIIIKYKNFLLNLNLKNPIDREIYLKNEYEKDNIQQLEEIIRKDDIKIFIDVGSHMGFYALNIASNEKMTVYAFEPININFEQLSENIKINNYKNVKKFNVALSNIKSRILMWVPDKNKTGGYSIYNEKDIELNKYNKDEICQTYVSADRGDNLIKIKNHKIAIKIDVERSEKYVLLGFEELILNNKIFLQIEIFDQLEIEMNKFLYKYNFKFLNKNGKDYFYKNY